MTNLQEKPNTKRSALVALSNSVAPLVKMEQFVSINEALLACYRTEEHRIFKTLRQWNKEGMQVKKGSEAFSIWARPKTNYKKENGVVTSQEDYTFFPMCFLFSNAQVEKSEKGE